MSHLTGGAVALELNGVNYNTSAGDVLLRDISFHIHPGEILVLAGPNGAGKTSLIKIIAGLRSATSGTIAFENTPYDSLSDRERAKQIAYVGQSDNPDGRLTVTQYIKLGRLPHVGALSRHDEAQLLAQTLQTTELEHLANRSLSQLSGGERQRAMIARAICQCPKLLILDEPTNHLDPRMRGDLLSLISHLGITIVAVLHDLTLIESFATHVAIIENGQLTGFGHPEDILSLDKIREVFAIDMHRLPHPTENRLIPTLDIPISKPIRQNLDQKVPS